jgi:fumarate reductase subunit D
MQRTRPTTLVLVAVVATALGWAVVSALSSRGITLPAVPWSMIAVLVVIAAVVLAMGLSVRRYLHGRHPTLNPIRAARTAVLAKAACYTGALLAGWYAAQAVAVLGDLGIESQRARALSAGLAVLGSLLLAGVGLLVEWMCRVPPPEDPEPAPPVVRDSPDPAAG